MWRPVSLMLFGLAIGALLGPGARAQTVEVTVRRADGTPLELRERPSRLAMELDLQLPPAASTGELAPRVLTPAGLPYTDEHQIVVLSERTGAPLFEWAPGYLPRACRMELPPGRYRVRATSLPRGPSCGCGSGRGPRFPFAPVERPSALAALDAGDARVLDELRRGTHRLGARATLVPRGLEAPTRPVSVFGPDGRSCHLAQLLPGRAWVQRDPAPPGDYTLVIEAPGFALWSGPVTVSTAGLGDVRVALAKRR